MSQFDPEIVPHIFDFGKRLSDLEADVFVLMARKAACFVDALRSLRLLVLRGRCTTDRALDHDTGWLRGLKVAIIDDALISGTTLYRTRERLLAMGASPVSTHVFCVNTKWWSPQLAQPTEPYLKLSDERTTGFCADLVHALSVIPAPYSVDFPVARNLRIRTENAFTLWSTPGWVPFDVSSPIQQATRVAALTLLPDDRTLAALDRSVGFPASRVATLSKLRLFTRHHSTDRDISWFHAMPVVVLDSLPEATVETLWHHLSRRVPSQRPEGLSIATKYRALQYLIADRLGWMYLKALGYEDRVDLQHREALGLLFPPELASFLHLCCQAHAPSDFVDITATSSPKEPRRPSVESTLVLQRRLCQPFLEMYQTRELPARQLVLARGVEALSHPEYSNTLDRLSVGISLQDLADRAGLTPEAGPALSIFLDQAIDRGIAVPVTRDHSGVVARMFRHGEDVLFGESEERLFFLAFNSFVREFGSPAVPRLIAEKLFVLLLRVGIQQGFLHRWLGALGADGTVGVRYYLKGAILKVGSPAIFSDGYDGSITSLLCQNGTLAQSGDGKYRPGNEPVGTTRVEAEPKARIVGTLLGRLTRRAGPIALSDQDLIHLSTCQSANDVASAIGAEIEIFSSTWIGLSRHLARQSANPRSLWALVHANPKIEESLTSALWKSDAWRQGAARQIIERIAETLGPDSLAQQTWLSFWGGVGTQEENSTLPELRRALRDEITWLLAALTEFRSLKIACLSDATSHGDHHSSVRLRDEVEKCKQLLAGWPDGEGHGDRAVLEGLIRASDTARLPFPVAKTVRWALKALATRAHTGRSLSDQVLAVVGQLGRPRRTTTFANALFIEVESRTEALGGLWERARGEIASLRAQAGRDGAGKVGASRLDVVPDRAVGYGHGIWVCAAGSFARTWLLRLAAEVLNVLSPGGSVRATLFANLPRDEQIVLGEMTGVYVGRNFWNRADSLLAGRPWLHPHDSLAVVSWGKADGAEQELTSTGFKQLGRAVRVPSETPFATELIVSSWQQKEVKQQKGVTITMPRAEIGIISIVTEEAAACRKAIAALGGGSVQPGRSSTRPFYEGRLQGPDGREYRAVLTQALDQGSRSVMNAYEALCEEASPHLVIVAGIGGAISKDVRLGDVVFAEHVYYYDKRKITPAGDVHRTEGYPTPALFRHWINQLFVDLGAEPAPLPGRGSARIHKGPIGSGEAVLAYRDAEVRKHLESINSKVLALETEAGGIASAFYEEDLRDDLKPTGYVIVRGISDHADEAKDDSMRSVAAENTAWAVREFVARLPPLWQP